MLRIFTKPGYSLLTGFNLLLIVLAVSFMPETIHADIYLKAEQGKFAVTNNPKDPDYVKVIDRSGEETKLEADRIQEAVEFASGEFQLPQSLIFSILRSYQDNEGGQLMPLPPGYVEKHGDTILRRPEQTIRVSVRFFQRMLKRYHGNMALTLAAYHAGPDRVDEIGGIPSDPEVRAFVSSVRDAFDQFESRETIFYTYRDQQGTLHVVNIR